MRRLKRRSRAIASFAVAALGERGGELGARLVEMRVGIAGKTFGKEAGIAGRERGEVGRGGEGAGQQGADAIVAER